MGLSTSIHDVKNLVLSLHPVVAIETTEEERVDQLLDAVASELGMPVFEWSVTRGLVRRPETTPNRSTQHAGALLGHLRGLTVEGLFVLKDLSPHLQDPAASRLFVEVAQRFANSTSTMVVIGAHIELPRELDHLAVNYDLALPAAKELEEAVHTLIASLGERRQVRMELASEDMRDLVSALSGLTVNQARQAVARCVLEDGSLTSSDLPAILESKVRALEEGGLLEYFPAEDNPYELGGFANMKRWLDRARVGFTPEAASLNLKAPGGILLVGVQGCGKSLAAKGIAREWRMPLLKLDAGRLYDKYIGQSEKNLRKAIEVAESISPVVLWIDELEKAFGGMGGDHDGGTSKRIFATLLTWMQEKEKPVFVVATANDLASLPPELLRKGRFDEIFFVDLPDPSEREAIFEIHLAHRRQEVARFDLAYLSQATEGWSGAEIEQAVTASLYDSLHRKRPLDNTLLLAEIQRTVPLSVSRAEDIARLRAEARDRFVPVR